METLTKQSHPRDLRDATAISGIGESAFSEGGGNRAETLIYDACGAAIEDAGLEPAEIDGVVTEAGMMPETVYTQDLKEMLGIEAEYSTSSLLVGAGNVISPLIAAQAIELGLAEHVLCYFGVNWATERETMGDDGGPYSYHTEDEYKANLEVPFGWVTQPLYIAAQARRHMHEYGTTTEQLGEVAIQTRANAARNEKATKREELTMDDYLDNPVIVDPFRVLDCCLISDGAAAFVVSSAEAAESGPTDPVYVKGAGAGSSEKSESTYMTQHDEYTKTQATKSGPKAFEMAGVTPEDIDFAEIYDCFTESTIVQLEDLGFCEKGDGGQFVQDRGITVEDGDLPVNTHGGLLSQAYILSMNHVTEAVRQLRGTADNQVPDPDLGLVTGWGGSEHATLILGSDRS
jgi:acetyl-CoA acetyltransferase